MSLSGPVGFLALQERSDTTPSALKLLRMAELAETMARILQGGRQADMIQESQRKSMAWHSSFRSYWDGEQLDISLEQEWNSAETLDEI